jgi:peptidoglycan hydrolase CwlO-like protein
MSITKKDLKHIIKYEILKASKDLGINDHDEDDVNNLDNKINKLVGENKAIFGSVEDLSNTIFTIREKLENIQLKINEWSTKVETINQTVQPTTHKEDE